VGSKEARKGCIQRNFERAGDGGQRQALLTEVHSDKKFSEAVYRCGACDQR